MENEKERIEKLLDQAAKSIRLAKEGEAIATNNLEQLMKAVASV